MGKLIGKKGAAGVWRKERMSEWGKIAAKLLSKKKTPAGVKTGVSKAPKYKGAPLPPIDARNRRKK